MKRKTIILILTLIAAKASFSQTYFDLFYTNIPKSKYNNYSRSNSNGLAWIKSGNYSWPESCKECFDYSRDGKVKKKDWTL